MTKFSDVGIFIITALILMVASSLFGTLDYAEAQAQTSSYPYNDKVSIGPVQKNIAISHQMGGEEQIAVQEQSNIIDTNYKGSLVNFGGVQLNVGIMQQLGGPDQTGVISQTNQYTNSGTQSSLVDIDPISINVPVLVQVKGLGNTGVTQTSYQGQVNIVSTSCTIGCS